MVSLNGSFLENIRKRFVAQKALGDRALAQLVVNESGWPLDSEANLIAVIVDHLCRSMLSGWTSFLADGPDKRDRDFERQRVESKSALLSRWEEGWSRLLQTLDELTEDDLKRMVMMRGRRISLPDAILWHLDHFGYHVAQIVYLSRVRKDRTWNEKAQPEADSQN